MVNYPETMSWRVSEEQGSTLVNEKLTHAGAMVVAAVAHTEKRAGRKPVNNPTIMLARLQLVYNW